MLANPYSVIRHTKNKSLLGITDQVRNKQYVIGFNKHYMAKNVCTWIHNDPIIRLKRKHNDNLTNDFNTALHGAGLEQLCVESLTVDYAAHLIIPKRSKGDVDDAEIMFNVMNIPASDFILYPFERSVGLILPTDLLRENRKEAIYIAQVIDPCFNADLFRSKLDSSFNR